MPLSLNLVRNNYLSLSELIDKLSCKPATLLKIKRGNLKKGSVADITIFDPKKRFKFIKKMINSKSTNSPFLGKTLIGKVFMTIVNGKIIFDNRS